MILFCPLVQMCYTVDRKIFRVKHCRLCILNIILCSLVIEKTSVYFTVDRNRRFGSSTVL
jgi:hypothetical protein